MIYMKLSIRKLLLAFFTLSATSVSAQTYYSVYDAKGQLVTEGKSVDVQGTRYLNEDWLMGSFTLDNGKSYKDIEIKYDELSDKMLIRNKNNETVRLIEQVNDFTIDFPVAETIVKRHFKLGYKNIPGTTDVYYFEILVDGKTQLLKRSSKAVQEAKDYNSASVNRAFVETIDYYIYRDNSGIDMKKDKKSVLAALGDHQPELDAYIKSNKLNLKSEADLAKLISYYNIL